MADYYTRFSFVIPLTAPVDWHDELIRLVATADEAPAGHPFGDPADDGYMGTPPVVERTHDGLAFYDDGGASCLETTARVVRWVLNQPGTPDSVTFEFACTCNKPRLGAFSGGAVKVTATTDAWIHTSDNAVDDLLDQIIAENLALSTAHDPDPRVDRSDPAQAAAEDLHAAGTALDRIQNAQHPAPRAQGIDVLGL